MDRLYTLCILEETPDPIILRFGGSLNYMRDLVRPCELGCILLFRLQLTHTRA